MKRDISMAQWLTKWDMDKPMPWGCFFTDASAETLRATAEVLEQTGCRVVDLHEPELGEGDEPYFFLHVEREEVHFPARLHARNAQLAALAERHDLRSDDGMDVGPPAST